MHLILKPSANDAATGALYLERAPLPDRYPLLDRGFHLVNESPLEITMLRPAVSSSWLRRLRKAVKLRV